MTANPKSIAEGMNTSDSFMALFNMMRDGYVIAKGSGEILNPNPAYLEMLGYTLEELLLVTWSELTPEKWRDWELKTHGSQLVERGFTDLYEKEYIHNNGTVFPVEVQAYLLNEPDHLDDALIGVFVRDITREKLVEEKQKLTSERFRKVFDAAPLAMLIVNAEGIVELVNQTGTEMFGYHENEMVGNSVEILLPAENRKQHPGLRAGFYAEGQTRSMVTGRDLYGKGKHDRTFPIEVGLSPVEIDGETKTLCTIIDITTRKQIEAEKDILEKSVQRLQKLETIGTLAAGIAHDFNNLLTPIMGYTDLAKSQLSASDPLHEWLSDISNATTRAAGLVDQILLFGKQLDKQKEPLALQLIIKEALKLIRPSIPSTIDIHQDIESDCGTVLADPTQVHQIIMNLCTNAWQAMELDGGVLSIELKQVEIDEAMARKFPLLHSGAYICLTVTDTGIGMDESTVEQIFEPFFTTKTVDKGTGMGLSVVHGIVHNHDGEIVVHSELGKGSKFQLYFPVNNAGVEVYKAGFEALQTGDESILIVDDEELITTMLREMLSAIGYTIDIYNNAFDALQAIKQDPKKYDLLISDLTMPGMTGTELMHEIQKFKPGFPTILMTGYAGDYHKRFPEHQVVLHKPIKVNTIAAMIRKVLD